MLILLPPSEGKAAPRRGARLDLARLSVPELTGARGQVARGADELCLERPRPGDAGAGPRTHPVRRRTPQRRSARRTDGPGRRDLHRRALRVARPRDAGCGRPSPGVAVAGRHLLGVRAGPPGRPDPVVPPRRRGQPPRPRLGRRALARSARPDRARRRPAPAWSWTCARAPTWRSGDPLPDLAKRVATVRVLHEVGTKRTVVSHFNKATKGRLVRALLEGGSDSGHPRPPGRRHLRPRLEGRAR